MAQNLKPTEAVINTSTYKSCQVFYKYLTSLYSRHSGLVLREILPWRLLWGSKSFEKNPPAGGPPHPPNEHCPEASLR